MHQYFNTLINFGKKLSATLFTMLSIGVPSACGTFLISLFVLSIFQQARIFPTNHLSRNSGLGTIGNDPACPTFWGTQKIMENGDMGVEFLRLRALKII